MPSPLERSAGSGRGRSKSAAVDAVAERPGVLGSDREPISPELVLVSPELAALARAQLRADAEERERVAASAAQEAGAAAPVLPRPRPGEVLRPAARFPRRSSWIEGGVPIRASPVRLLAVATLAIAAIAYAALSSERGARPAEVFAPPPGVRLQAATTAPGALRSARPVAAASHGATVAARSRGRRAKPRVPVRRPVLRQKAVAVPLGPERQTPAKTPRNEPSPRPRRSVPARPPLAARVGAAPGVLGVEVASRPGAVLLRWQPPADFSRVVIRRFVDGRARATLVYSGRAKKFADRRVRPRTVYRYVIVSYDRSGRRSSGVPTVVST